MHELRILTSDGAGKKCQIEGPVFTIGSSGDCSLVIDSLNVSDIHAELVVEDATVTIKDMGTLIGTFVNGEPVTEKKLDNNDEILIDTLRILYKKLYQQGDVEVVLDPSSSGLDSIFGSVIDKRAAEKEEKEASPSPGAESSLIENDFSIIDEITTNSECDPKYGEFWDSIRNQVEQILNNLQTLVRIGKMVNSELELDPLLNIIIEKTINLMKAERGFIVLHHKKTGKLDVVVARGMDDKLEGNEKKLFSSNIIRKVIGDGQPYVSSNVLADNSIDGQSKFLHKIRSCICVPLKCRGDIIGALYIDHTGTSNRFDQDQVKFLDSFANQAAIAIDNARLYNMAVTDALTGLFTRQHFVHRLDAEVEKVRDSGTQFSLLILDIDNFQRINDKYSRKTGNTVIRKVAETIKETVGRAGIPARYEGQKFAVILPGKTIAEARDTAEQIRQGIKNRLINTQHGNIYVTISIGIATHDPAKTPLTADGEREKEADIDCGVLFEQANRALRTAKENGRNRVTIFESAAGDQVDGGNQAATSNQVDAS